MVTIQGLSNPEYHKHQGR